MPDQQTPEQVARAFHEAYERLAPSFGYKTREASAVPWADVPAQNKALMVAVAAELIANGYLLQPGRVEYGIQFESDDETITSLIGDLETARRMFGSEPRVTIVGRTPAGPWIPVTDDTPEPQDEPEDEPGGANTDLYGVCEHHGTPRQVRRYRGLDKDRQIVYMDTLICPDCMPADN